MGAILGSLCYAKINGLVMLCCRFAEAQGKSLVRTDDQRPSTNDERPSSRATVPQGRVRTLDANLGTITDASLRYRPTTGYGQQLLFKPPEPFLPRGHG